MTELEAWEKENPRPYTCRCGCGIEHHRPNIDGGSGCSFCEGCDMYSEKGRTVSR